MAELFGVDDAGDGGGGADEGAEFGEEEAFFGFGAGGVGDGGVDEAGGTDEAIAGGGAGGGGAEGVLFDGRLNGGESGIEFGVKPGGRAVCQLGSSVLPGRKHAAKGPTGFGSGPLQYGMDSEGDGRGYLLGEAEDLGGDIGEGGG